MRLSESTITESFYRFMHLTIRKFGSEYIRKPSREDLERILSKMESRGFPGCIGNVDCSHFVWKQCPKAWNGQYQGKSGKRSIVMEIVTDYELWIWSLIVGLPGSLNDINCSNTGSPYLTYPPG